MKFQETLEKETTMFRLFSFKGDNANVNVKIDNHNNNISIMNMIQLYYYNYVPYDHIIIHMTRSRFT